MLLLKLYFYNIKNLILSLQFKYDLTHSLSTQFKINAINSRILENIQNNRDQILNIQNNRDQILNIQKIID